MKQWSSDAALAHWVFMHFVSLARVMKIEVGYKEPGTTYIILQQRLSSSSQ